MFVHQVSYWREDDHLYSPNAKWCLDHVKPPGTALFEEEHQVLGVMETSEGPRGPLATSALPLPSPRGVVATKGRDACADLPLATPIATSFPEATQTSTCPASDMSFLHPIQETVSDNVCICTGWYPPISRKCTAKNQMRKKHGQLLALESDFSGSVSLKHQTGISLSAQLSHGFLPGVRVWTCSFSI